MNEIQTLRYYTGLSQSKFARKFGIPLRTVQNWEINQSSPPSYVISMMAICLEHFGIIDETTRRDIEDVTKLAKRTAHKEGDAWILPFSECTRENQNDYLFYDDSNPMPHGGENDPVFYNIISSFYVDENEKYILDIYGYPEENITIQYRAPYVDCYDAAGNPLIEHAMIEWTKHNEDEYNEYFYIYDGMWFSDVG